MNEPIKCPICDKEQWEYMDDLRDPAYWIAADYIGPDDKIGWKWCKACGFVTYDYVSDQELDRRYALIRPSINPGNLVTQYRKREYHKRMLEGRTFDAVLDYGCSIGTALDSIQATTKIGIELSDISREAARMLYGLDVFKTLDESKEVYSGQFDLIMLYHVLEHLQEPDKILAQLVELLTKDGMIYIAVPEYWKPELSCASGEQLRDIENYWHLNHVNMFSRQDLANLLTKVGLSVLEYNDKLYGYTVLAYRKPGEFKADKTDKRKMAKCIKEAVTAYAGGDAAAAIKVWPYYPEAICADALSVQTMMDGRVVLGKLRDALKKYPDSEMIRTQYVQSCMQWDDNRKGNKVMTPVMYEAQRTLEKMIEEKPGNDHAMFLLGVIYIKYGRDLARARNVFERACVINPTRWMECNKVLLAGLTYGDANGCA